MKGGFRGTLSAVALILVAGAAAGPIDPPAGPVSGTMKPLDRVEPRIAVGPDTTPGDSDGTPSLYKITEPGSYYLTSNLEGVAGRHGIEIACSDVTLDLNGFTLVSGGGNIAGVWVDGASRNVAVRNGTLTGWLTGVNSEAAAASRIEGLSVASATGSALRIGPASLVRQCTVTTSGGGGITASGGCVIEDCFVQGVDTTGILTDGSCVVRGCTVREAGNEGIHCGPGSTILGCLVSSSGSHGIFVVSDSTVKDNTCEGNGAASGAWEGAGIMAFGDGNTIGENACSGNDAGITIVGGRNHVADNELIGNSHAGLHVTGQTNVIVRNTARNVGGVNWYVAPGNRGGAFVAPAQNSTLINGATGGPGSGTTDPFANISF